MRALSTSAAVTFAVPLPKKPVDEIRHRGELVVGVAVLAASR